MLSLLGFSILLIPIQSKNPNATWEEPVSTIHALMQATNIFR